MKEPTLQVEIICADKPTICDEHAYGWGEDAVATRLTGRAMNITVKLPHEKMPEFGIRIHKDGTLTLTSYGGSYTVALDHNARLEPSRPFSKPEKEVSK